MLLLFLLVFVYAVLGKELFGNEALQQALDDRPDIPSFDVMLYWGSVPRSMVTLMQLFVDDGSIDNLSRPIGEVWPVMWIFFLSYYLLVTVSMMELLTAVYLDALLSEKERQESQSRMATRGDAGKVIPPE